MTDDDQIKGRRRRSLKRALVQYFRGDGGERRYGDAFSFAVHIAGLNVGRSANGLRINGNCALDLGRLRDLMAALSAAEQVMAEEASEAGREETRDNG